MIQESFESLFAGKGVKEQAVSAKYRSILVLDLSHGKGFPGGLQKLHIGPTPLLEAEENGGGWFHCQQVLQSLQKQWEGGFKVDAICSEDDVGLVFENFLRKRFAPTSTPGVRT